METTTVERDEQGRVIVRIKDDGKTPSNDAPVAFEATIEMRGWGALGPDGLVMKAVEQELHFRMCQRFFTTKEMSETNPSIMHPGAVHPETRVFVPKNSKGWVFDTYKEVPL